MEKIIWVISNNKAEIIEAQRRINAIGSMRTLCMLSFEAVCKAVESRYHQEVSRISTPSLLILDYDSEREQDFETLSYLKAQQELAGVPIAFMVSDRSEELDEYCYSLGAIIILSKPFSQSNILRIERIAWQYEVTRNYEKKLQEQAGELQAAQEILSLNQQLQSRNELLHRIFVQYFSDKLLNLILEHPEDAAIGGEKRELTVMMADLRGFTSMSEQLEPDIVTDMLNFFFGKMLHVINKYHGMVLEYLGDAILAVFGAPLETENQTEDAIAAAITMQNRMGDVNEYNRSKGYPQLEMGIGIHRGEMFIGNIGSQKMMRYNVIGHAVNECSRIESYTVGGQILTSHHTLQYINCPVETHNHRNIITKGIKKPVRICEVTGIGGDYQCHLENVEFYKLYPVKVPVIFNLFPLAGKKIAEHPIMAKLTHFSPKRAKVSVDVERITELQEYQDVEIFAAQESGCALFTNVYAKIMEKGEHFLTLHFTHINKNFSRFAEKVFDLQEDITLSEITKVEKYGFTPADFTVSIPFTGRCFRDQKNKCIVLWLTENLPLIELISMNLHKNTGCPFVLTVYESPDEMCLNFFSNTREIRALEFLDFIISEYSLIKGDASIANGRISSAILRVQMADRNMQQSTDYILQRCQDYFSDCMCIQVVDYMQTHKDALDQMELYHKIKIPWAYVCSTDVVPKGKKFFVKSLENESGMTITATDNIYIMIGCRGEVYDIQAEKFHKTYEATKESLNILDQMLDFIPTIETLPEEEYISIDEIAHLCYPKNQLGIYACQLDRRTKVFPINYNQDYFVGRPGDYLAVREDDLQDIYIIQKDIFGQTYEKRN